jgi:hypothetical protein
MNRGALQRTALIYDFDGTLAPGNLQEHGFISAMGMSNEAFWHESNTRARVEDADPILAYMRLMLEKSNKRGIPITRQALRAHGATVKLFDGLSDQSWFRRMNAHGASYGLALEHYIISSGIEEMIRGCAIVDQFRNVFASKFIYNDRDEAIWPGVAINYTTKTQYLFRINRGIHNHWDGAAMNSYMAKDERPVPFSHIIFIGDGDTDVPAMKMVTYKGGCAIAVYDPSIGPEHLEKIHHLIADRRVDFVAPADYTENGQLDIIIRGILSRIARDSESGNE